MGSPIASNDQLVYGGLLWQQALRRFIQLTFSDGYRHKQPLVYLVQVFV